MTAALAIGPADVAFRRAAPNDLPHVLQSWLTSHSRSPGWRHMPRAVYWRGHHDLIIGILARSDTTVACAPTNPDAILGWVTTAGEVLHYVHVKPVYRRLGIARRLLEHLPERCRYTHKTAIVSELPVPSLWQFDPYPAFGVT